MKTSNVELLAEIDTLENIKRVDANELEVVKHIDQKDAQINMLREALAVAVEMAYCVDQYSTIESERKSELKIINKAQYLTDPQMSENDKAEYLAATEPKL